MRLLGHWTLGDELEVVELVGDQLGRRRAGADAQVVAQRALLAFRLVGQARHDALDHALLAALGTVDRIAFAGDRHAVQGGEAAGSPDGAARRGGGAGADVETLVGHSALLRGESWNVAELGCLGLWKRSKASLREAKGVFRVCDARTFAPF